MTTSNSGSYPNALRYGYARVSKASDADAANLETQKAQTP